MLKRIDAHQHFWRLARGDYGWLTPAIGAIHRDFLPPDLAPLLLAAGVEATVLVQAAPTEAETEFLIDLAGETPFVAGVVGWIDFDAPDAPHRIARLAERPKLVGLRPMIQDLPDHAWMLRKSLTPAFGAMIAHGLALDALVRPRHLPVLLEFAARHPDLPIVIDHGAKPDIAAGALEPWASDIRLIARDTEVYCKLSGLVTEARPGAPLSEVAPYIETLLDAFGAERLMWGSDWPVLNLNGDYASWFEQVRAVLGGTPGDHLDWILGRTAASFYSLET
jgi:L-fuconolactonase